MFLQRPGRMGNARSHCIPCYSRIAIDIDGAGRERGNGINSQGTALRPSLKIVSAATNDASAFVS